MKQRFGSLILALLIALSSAISAGAAKVAQTPEELYQEYLSVAAEINEALGTDISIIPLEDMDPNDMPTVEEVASNVRELAMMKVSMRNSMNAAQTENSAIAPCALGTNNPYRYVTGTWGNKQFTFKCSATLVISTPTGTADYFIQSYSKPLVVAYSVPSGYTLTAGKPTQYALSPNSKSFTVSRLYTVEYGSAMGTFQPGVKFSVNSSNGVISSEILGV